MENHTHHTKEHADEHIVPTGISEIIQYIGVKDLSEDERMALEQVSASYHEKVKRKVHNYTSLSVHAKIQGPKNDKQKKFSMNVRLMAPTKTMEANAVDYDIRKAVHMAFEALIHEIEHNFHEEGGVAQKMMGK